MLEFFWRNLKSSEPYGGGRFMGLGSQACAPIYERGFYPFCLRFRYDDLTEVLVS